MLDILKLRLEKVFDLLCSVLLGCMLLAEDFGDIRGATSVPRENLKNMLGGS